MKKTKRRRDRLLLRKIASRRLKSSKETVLLAVGMLFSLMLVSFFLFFTMTVKAGTSALAGGLPHSSFVKAVSNGMETAAALLSVATVLSVRTWAGLSRDASAQTVAVLHSMGATSAQQRYLLLTELSMQYLPAMLVGITVGAVGGIGLSLALIGTGVIGGEPFAWVLAYILLWLAILLVSGGLLVLCYTLPHLRLRRRTPSATESLRRKGQSVSAETHSYRQSKTYQKQSLLKRLAGKSVDFYKARYTSLALSLSVSGFYPVLALLLIYHLMGASVLMDTNPFDGVDTTEAVAGSVAGLMAVIAVGFLLLTAQGVWGGILLIRAQLAQRRQTGRVYLSMGMTEEDFRRVMRLELGSLLLRSLLYLFLLILIANFFFLRNLT